MGFDTLTSDDICCDCEDDSRGHAGLQPMEGLGSEFPWEDFPSGPHLAWPAPNLFYGLGRHALVAACRQRATTSSRLWVPRYFCPQVTHLLADQAVAVVQYDDLPTSPGPDWESLDARPGDAVLAINFFGVRDGKDWRDWREEHPSITLIEDHTHDPLSRWARSSNADFAFASLRKVLPVPDGAILWSPRHGRLPAEPADEDWRGSALKLVGMICKRSGTPRETHRGFETRGERALQRGGGPAITPWSRALLAMGYPLAWRAAREKNVEEFLAVADDRLAHVPWVRPLFTTWPTGACPLNPVLVFHDVHHREAVRTYLIHHRVYTPVHWRLDGPRDDRSASVSKRILTIPLDHRCRPEWIPQIVEWIAAPGQVDVL